jgi:uncharacterized membrane protein
MIFYLAMTQPSMLWAKWSKFRHSFWFLPLCLNLIAIVMGVTIPYVESFFRLGRIDSLDWMLSTADSARSILGAIAGALITETTMIFSVTMVSLSLTASQYGSQPLRTFMTRGISQLTLGMFLGTSMYCLIVLFWVQDGENVTFVPHASVVVALVLTVVNHLLFIYFLDQIATSLQSNVVVKTIADDLSATIDRLYPSQVGQKGKEVRKNLKPLSELVDGLEIMPHQLTIMGPGAGFIQIVDTRSLMKLASRDDLVIRLLMWPGDFLCDQKEIAVIYSQSKLDHDEMTEHLHRAMILGSRRTPDQDVESAVWELVEVAVRALSPGINDPITALICIDYMGVSLRRLAGSLPVDERRVDDEGHLRLLIPSVSFKHVLRTAFGQIQLYGRENGLILERLLDQLKLILPACHSEEHRQVVSHHAELIGQIAEANVQQPQIVEKIRQQVDALQELSNQVD